MIAKEQQYTRLENAMLRLTLTSAGLELSSPSCTNFILEPLRPQITIDDVLYDGDVAVQNTIDGNSFSITWKFGTSSFQLIQHFLQGTDNAIVVKNTLRNDGNTEATLNRVRLLNVETSNGGRCELGDGNGLRFYEQSNTAAQVRVSGSSGMSVGVQEDPTQVVNANGDSQMCWVAYNAAQRFAWLVGFVTSDRFDGRIETAEISTGDWQQWAVGFDGGDLLVDGNSEVALEEIVMFADNDATRLLETYGDWVKQRHNLKVLNYSPVTWCSWYAYRFKMTHDRVVANAHIAMQRLQPLGLSIFEVDLGWEKQYLPSSYEENAQFPSGLQGLSDALEELGFQLGVWRSFATISAFDAVAKEHPEWLVGSPTQQPAELGEWYWIPHGQTYALDLTHPDAQKWLREKVASIFQRGAQYIKADFAGVITWPQLRRRHDSHIVSGGGFEAARILMSIVREESQRSGATPLLLNIGLPELPGAGSFDLLYTCADTGNTGYNSFDYLRRIYGSSLACHLWKQGRLGVLQTSCLVIGLPGTLEEARLRATATFLTGGEVNISDDLTVLPEDRWSVLTATLPPTGRAARPLDLFDPIECTSLDPEAMCRGEEYSSDSTVAPALGCSRVWHLEMETDWDTWQLLGMFNYEAVKDEAGAEQITAFQLPLDRLPLEKNQNYWAFEFWSGQFLGTIPEMTAADPLAPTDYVHPGDAANMLAMREDMLEVSFFGPAVKLLALRPARQHPWVAGTSFHQSSGSELKEVQWTNTTNSGILRGELHRPPGETGAIYIAGVDISPVKVTVNGHVGHWQNAANGAYRIPILTEDAVTEWSVEWGSVL